MEHLKLKPSSVRKVQSWRPGAHERCHQGPQSPEETYHPDDAQDASYTANASVPRGPREVTKMAPWIPLRTQLSKAVYAHGFGLFFVSLPVAVPP